MNQNIPSTYCPRSWGYFLVDLGNLEQKVCCKTEWKPMLEGEDWFNNSDIRNRRLDHLENRRHSDCNYCWSLEDQNQLSPRLIGFEKDSIITSSLDPDNWIMLELQLGNTCDLACRYCGPRHSSVWVSRLQDQQNSKSNLFSIKNSFQSQILKKQFYDWVDKYSKDIKLLVINGGEPTLMSDTYNILEQFNWNNVGFVINTNLNTPPYYLEKLQKTIDMLLTNNNRVYFRVSIDGVGKQNDWQRQNSNWERLKNNLFAIGSKQVYMHIALTVTPLTLESMPELAYFIENNSNLFYHKPEWKFPDIVVAPNGLNPTEWFIVFQKEIQEFLSIIGDSSPAIKEQLNTWLSSSIEKPSYNQVKCFVEFLDESQSKWGGEDWRTIYPKTATIVNDILQ